MNELNVLILCRELPPHPNVVQMFGVSLDGPQPVIVMEYCSGGISFVTFVWLEILRNDKVNEIVFRECCPL
jgi:serine/threonine protein kinase